MNKESSVTDKQCLSDVAPCNGFSDPESSLGQSHIVKDALDITTLIVSAEDNPTLPALTFRFWVIGIGLAVFGSVLSEIYFWKPQGTTVSSLFQLIVSYVLGNAMHRTMPSTGFWRHLNPGPFNIKEHTCITVMASTASLTASSIGIIATLDLFYGINLHPASAIFQTFASQLIGYGFAGVLRNLLVWPTHALYPNQLPSISLLQSMHLGGLLNRRKMKYFWIVFTAIFCWEIVPTWMFPLLTAVSAVCIIDNGRSSFVRNLDWVLLSFAFDWTLITQAYPFFWPLQTQVSAWVGLSFCYILMKGLPFMSSSLFTGNGSTYNQTSILDAQYQLDIQEYAVVGPPYMTTTFAVSQLAGYASMGAAFSHVILWHWRELWVAFKNFNFLKTNQDFDDVHFQKMKAYKEVPQWWYCVLFGVSLALAIGTAYADVNLLPWWSIIMFTAIAFIVAVVLSFIYAVTGHIFIPNNPVRNMYAKLYGYNTGYQTLYMVADLKLGQYAKVPPRSTFVAQLSGAIIGAIFNYILYKSIVGAHREDLQNPIGTRLWSGWNAQQINSAAITWGALARELYAPGKIYFQLPLGHLYGFLAPFPLYFMHRLYPSQRIWSYLNMPVILTYVGWLPYSVNGAWWPGFVIGLASQWWARTRRPKWYTMYNCEANHHLTLALVIHVFVNITGAGGNIISFPYWWGNPDPAISSVGAH
ncbi:OPT oligopeptide transporter protein-domain-containing protein [Pisolithus sp. B1]|nr:OPT oligopeptide transporter protein-domain-containing protein [Pisolithus sp. B1]